MSIKAPQMTRFTDHKIKLGTIPVWFTTLVKEEHQKTRHARKSVCMQAEGDRTERMWSNFGEF